MVSAVLALDGGGSKTDLALVAQDGGVLWRGRGAGVNPFDQPRWADLLRGLLAQVPQPYRAVGLGLPGYGEAPELTALQDVFGRSLGVPLALVNDVEAAHLGAFAGGAGSLILAGTGSMVWAADAAGGRIRVGGWGDSLGDEGSAHWLGREALNRLTRALDGRLEAGGLDRALLDALRAQRPNLAAHSSPALVLGWLAGLAHPRSGIAALARVVDEAADTGEPQACALLAQAAEELALAARAAQRQLPTAGPRWSMAGGVAHSRTLRAHLLDALGPQHFQEAALPPLGGAALLAARLAGWPSTPAWLAALSHHLTHFTPEASHVES